MLTIDRRDKSTPNDTITFTAKDGRQGKVGRMFNAVAARLERPWF